MEHDGLRGREEGVERGGKGGGAFLVGDSPHLLIAQPVTRSRSRNARNAREEKKEGGDPGIKGRGRKIAFLLCGLQDYAPLSYEIKERGGYWTGRTREILSRDFVRNARPSAQGRRKSGEWRGKGVAEQKEWVYLARIGADWRFFHR